MSKIILTPAAGEFVAKMLISCGAKGCDLSVSRLFGMNRPVNLTSFQSKGNWLKPVFGNLNQFATEEGLTEIDIDEVVYYFGGRHHIDYMIRKATQSDLGYLMSLDAGLVLDVLLPLTNGFYQNGKEVLILESFVEVNSKDSGVAFFHRGLVVRADVSEEVVRRIFQDQRQSKEFMLALGRLGGSVALPENLLSALRRRE